jgi:CDP-glycerol glycerophosphotransferase (TagB/SpsB family)
VTLGNISGWLSKFDKDLSMITTVSQKEHDSYLTEGYNYDEDIIQILGFPRYDNLKNNPKKQILIIPTWRKYLKGNKNAELLKDAFKAKDYLIKYQKKVIDKYVSEMRNGGNKQ